MFWFRIDIIFFKNENIGKLIFVYFFFKLRLFKFSFEVFGLVISGSSGNIWMYVFDLLGNY